MTENGQPHVSINVRDYVDLTIAHQREIFIERERFLAEKFVTIEEARTLAKIEQDRRLESMNEFREQLNKQANTFVTRELLDGYLNAIRQELKTLETISSKNEGGIVARAWFVPSGPALIGIILSVASFALATAALFYSMLDKGVVKP